mgnify:CR=1 FL=1
MNAIETWESIDYDELLADLLDDIESGMLTNDTELYIIRQNGQVKIAGTDLVVSPVFDYFYDEPALEPKLRDMTIVDLKKICYDIKDKLANTPDGNMKEILTETIEIEISELSGYTKNNSKRNDEPCKVIFTKENENFPSCPLLFFYKDDDCKDEIETIKATILIDELLKCSKGNSEE